MQNYATLMHNESKFGLFYIFSFLLIFIIGIHNILIAIICSKVEKLKNK